MVAAFIDDMSAPMPSGSLVAFHLYIHRTSTRLLLYGGSSNYMMVNGQTKQSQTSAVAGLHLLTDAAGASSGLPPLM
eukprot:COSAG02_NODE_4842_length_4916_cov_2.448204_6_plen_77_part_00